MGGQFTELDADKNLPHKPTSTCSVLKEYVSLENVEHYHYQFSSFGMMNYTNI